MSRGSYSEVQCIIGNGHMGNTPPDRMTDRKHYLLATSLAHCMNEVFVDSVEKSWDLQHHIWLAVTVLPLLAACPLSE